MNSIRKNSINQSVKQGAVDLLEELNGNVIKPKDFPFEALQHIPVQKAHKGNNGGKNKKRFKNIYSTFDIETTRIAEIEQSVMYIWQWCFMLPDYSYTVVVGRTWAQFRDFTRKLAESLNGDNLCVYVHNLSYEFQFLRGIYEFQKDEVFAIDSRKILKCCMLDTIEFRCSYLHSNMSLALFTEKYHAKHAKLDGVRFDYTKQRFSTTPLTQYEMAYCINDVVGLCEALITELTHDGDTFNTVPLTSTGYVRRDAKKAMRLCPNLVKPMLPDIELYEVLREAFRGGNTHANRFYAGQLITGDIQSDDRSSSYPAVMCCNQFPMSKFYLKEDCTLEELNKLIDIRKRACVFRVALGGITLKNPYWGSPYLSTSKCRNIIHAEYDNGRILSAEYLETTFTDIDFKIFKREYNAEYISPITVYHARYGKLPGSLIGTIEAYYKAKTELKGVKEQEIFYMKSKNKLNSLYGMCAQDPVKHSILFYDNDYHDDDMEDAELLEEHNEHAFLPYQWGVWVTAWARLRLEEGIEACGDNFLYTDTDSVKHLGSVDFTEYNKERIKEAKKAGAFATDPAGHVHYMGVFEHEDDMKRFITLGSKKYCYETKDGKLHLTCAGVNKKKGAAELLEHGGIEAFKIGFIFVKGGGTESVYNDTPEIETYTHDGITERITSNVVIRDSTYTLGITKEYAGLLNACKVQITNV